MLNFSLVAVGALALSDVNISPTQRAIASTLLGVGLARALNKLEG